MKIELLFQEELLGTKPDNIDIFGKYVDSKRPKGDPRRDELENAEVIEETGSSVFHKLDGMPCIYDYQIKGFFKDACAAINRMETEFRAGLEKLSAYKSKIDGCIFVYPRLIPIILPAGGQLGLCERPLRTDGPQGQRVALCRSESVPAGSKLQFDVEILSKELNRYVQVWFDYGAKRGLGQWRNSGKGRFTWAQLDG